MHEDTSHNRPRILITADFSDDQVERLRRVGDVVIEGWGVTGDVVDADEFRGMVQGIDILIIGYEPVTDEVMAASRLRYIASIRGGPGANIDLASAGRRGIPVTGTVGREARPVADFTFGLILGLLRHIPRTYLLLKDGSLTDTRPTHGSDIAWGMRPEDPWNRFKGIELSGKTLGLIGYGTVGREVAQRARGFDMKVLAYDPYVQTANVPLRSLDEVLRAADIVSIHARMSEQSRGLIDRKAFEIMKPGAYSINTARAAIVDREALLDALTSGNLAGAALDVHYKEPLDPDDPFLQLDNVIVTPHVAGATVEVVLRHSQLVADNVFRFLEGQPLVNVVNQAYLRESSAPSKYVIERT